MIIVLILIKPALMLSLPKRLSFTVATTTPLICHLLATDGRARALQLSLPHGKVDTPVYMPVGTKGAMKGITQDQMQQMGCQLLLANTYHLQMQPGSQFIDRVGSSLHQFIGWPSNILTDSGGYQMVSFGSKAATCQQGVTFNNPYNHSSTFMRPQDCMAIQNRIGADIMMALDDVSKATEPSHQRMTTAMNRTTRWLARCKQAHKNIEKQALFPIIQGGISPSLRQQSLKDILALSSDSLGFAIGGLSGGQHKNDFFNIVSQCCEQLPLDKPRYLMGVGHPVDLVLCSLIGVDMFDCVYATRTARFGTAFTDQGQLKIKQVSNQYQFDPIQPNCQCQTCRHYSRAYLWMVKQEEVFRHLLSIHNIHYLLTLLQQVRTAIKQGRVASFTQKFLQTQFKEADNIPEWVYTAIKLSGLKIEPFAKQ